MWAFHVDGAYLLPSTYKCADPALVMMMKSHLETLDSLVLKILNPQMLYVHPYTLGRECLARGALLGVCKLAKQVPLA